MELDQAATSCLLVCSTGRVGLDVSQTCDEMKLWDGSWDTCTCGEGGDDGLAWASRVNRNVSDYGDDGDCVNKE